MDSFDDSIKKIMEQGSLHSAPTGYSWDENADAIYTKMESQPSKRRPVLFWILASLSIVSIVAIWIWFAQSVEHPATSEYIDQAIVPADGINDEPTDTEIEIEEKAISQVTTPDIHNIAKEALEQKPPIQASVQRQVDVPVVANVAHATSLKDVVNRYDQQGAFKTLATEANHTAVAEQRSRLLPSSQSRMVSKVSTQPEGSQTKRTSLISIPYAATLPLQVLADSDVPYLPLLGYTDVPTVVSNVQVPPKQLSYKIGLRGGTDIVYGQYSGPAALRNEFSRWLPGYHLGLDMAVTNDRGWSVALGYDHDLAVQLFDFSAMDSVPHTEHDVVTHIVTNALTGGVSTRTETVSQQLARARDYKTYNTFRSHSVSVLLGKELNLGRSWTANIGAGARYTIVRASEGYNLDSLGEILAYETGNDLYSSTAIDMVMNVGMAYGVSEHLSMMAYVRANQSMTNWSAEEGTRYRPLMLQLGTGVQYNF